MHTLVVMCNAPISAFRSELAYTAEEESMWQENEAEGNLGSQQGYSRKRPSISDPYICDNKQYLKIKCRMCKPR